MWEISFFFFYKRHVRVKDKREYRLEANRFFKRTRYTRQQFWSIQIAYGIPRGRMIDTSVDVLSFLTTTSIPALIAQSLLTIPHPPLTIPFPCSSIFRPSSMFRASLSLSLSFPPYRSRVLALSSTLTLSISIHLFPFLYTALSATPRFHSDR